MKLIIFGATGQTGQELVKQAIAHDHDVTAFVRNPDKLALQDERLRVVTGDVLNQEDVNAALAGQDAVLTALGTESLAYSGFLERSLVRIINAMKVSGVTRIGYVASAGVDKELPGAQGLLAQQILKNPLRDHRQAIDLLKQADVDYTVARPLRLMNGPLTGMYRQAADGVPDQAKQINRADVAHFLLGAIEQDESIRESVGLAE
ncbi:NAD(P)-binding oxidoreductase [Exiguobacterium sp. s193]|uniref:NAD(P)-dependent oxidoreductase n=1 Tax=Exiguobacterium sp. s193 TaxID=2751207 RepID=UPI001BE93977|nr:NAD(P)-binding oxidoreductase [Exiguobacterium sp. s193]